MEVSENRLVAGGGPSPRRIHFVGICGKGMGAIAAALAAAGWEVSGSDADCYPPMSDFLAGAGISISMPHAASNLPVEDGCDVVVGKRIREDNVELRALLDRGLRPLSFPEFLHENFLRHSRNAVVAGGAGKTTTTAMLTWILECVGFSPDYLIGDLPRNLTMPARLRGSSVAVIEGDEYASGVSDPRPKFLHYQPEVAILTNLLEDHPDLYAGAASLRQAFGQLAQIIPPHGRLILPADDPAIGPIREAALCETITVGFSAASDRRIDHWEPKPDRIDFRVGATPFSLRQYGRMNALNAAMAAAAAESFGVTLSQSAEALVTSEGVRNRQEELAVGGGFLVGDKATHPVSITGLIEGLRERFPGRRLVVVIQPRATGGREWIYQRDLPTALALADETIIMAAYEHNPGRDRQWPGGPFSTDQLAADIAARSTPVTVVRNPDELSGALLQLIRPGDVVALSLHEKADDLRRMVENTMAKRGVDV